MFFFLHFMIYNCLCLTRLIYDCVLACTYVWHIFPRGLGFAEEKSDIEKKVIVVDDGWKMTVHMSRWDGARMCIS